MSTSGTKINVAQEMCTISSIRATMRERERASVSLREISGKCRFFISRHWDGKVVLRGLLTSLESPQLFASFTMFSALIKLRFREGGTTFYQKVADS